MGQAFIIMQIGNKELDEVCRDIMVPALKMFNLDPKRVDKHNKGGLLKSEIIEFIKNADIIVADLTNERPNCYLEVGYAMGKDKYSNLILTAREDHNPDSPNYVKNGSKVHFDLAGYDILWWEKANLGTFKKELEKRIKRRLTAISPTVKTVDSPLDKLWIDNRQSEAFSDFTPLGNVPFMEVEMALVNSKLNIDQVDLLKLAEKAVIHTTGWPIGMVMHSHDKRPKPNESGIVARIPSSGENCYDYWALKKNGQFYMLRTEDVRKKGTLAFDTKIFRITEVLLYCASLYTSLGASSDSKVFISINHGGLKNCELSRDQGLSFSDSYKSEEDSVHSEIVTTIEEIKPNIIDLVEKIVKPLLVLFDFFCVPRNSLEEVVQKFVG